MRGWYSGCALAFQASETGSIPVPRSRIWVVEQRGYAPPLQGGRCWFESNTTHQICLCSLMVKQRIYIPCATDNWPIQVRVLSEAPSFELDGGLESQVADAGRPA